MLALLVAVSLLLLTAYFGESPSSPLHTIQRGIVQVVSPIQKGASYVLSPVRDLSNWVSDTLHAKSQNGRYRAQVQRLTRELDTIKSQHIEYQQLVNEVGLQNDDGIDSYKPVAADVIERDPSLWYQQITVDRGSDDGVVAGDPVIGDGALVGDVTTVDPSVSIVTLLGDHTLAVTAEVLDPRGDTGLLVPAVGNPHAMLLQDLPGTAPIAGGDQVVTAGFKDGSLTSLYPQGIPIGTVVDFDPASLLSNDEVTVQPSADLRHLDFVQILTRPHPGDLRAQVP